MSLLDTINSPEDIRSLDADRLPQLAAEVRERIVDVISTHKGAHFGSNLGTVELTVALHRVFNTPRDQLIWDVGHQAYPHKILTGRNEALPSIRKRSGLSPFLRRDESDYDVFGAGHAGTSISAACGIAAARDIRGDDFEVIAVIGDGSMTCGMPFEALNNAGATDRDMIVILNDNQMSISPNVGAMHAYLTTVRTNPLYNRVRDEIKKLVHSAPRFGSLGELVEQLVTRADDVLKGMFVPGMLFEELGFRYVGPVDGHNVEQLVSTLEDVREMNGPRLVHVVTTKGKGFALGEADPVKWHANSGPFDRDTGASLKEGAGALPRYQKVFGQALADLADEDPAVVAITAAMSTGTSTDIFQARHPERFFDVGIAEGHGVTFAAGLATQGIKPVVAIYSTFLQRAYDSIVHDVALQKLPVIFCMDRAGVAGEDGPTHHGWLDIAYLLPVQGMTITAPKDGDELIGLLRTALNWTGGPFSIRYPRDSVPAEVSPVATIPQVPYGTWELLREGEGIALLATGTTVGMSAEAARLLEQDGINATVVNCRFIKPLDEAMLERLFPAHSHVLTVEEGTLAGGFGAFARAAIGERWPEVSSASHGLPDEVVPHGERAGLLEELNLTPASIADRVRALLGQGLRPALRETG